MKSKIEPDPPPRDSPFHRRIIRTCRISNTRVGHYLDLECGHRVMSFGDLAHAEGRVLCTQCRDGVPAV